MVSVGLHNLPSTRSAPWILTLTCERETICRCYENEKVVITVFSHLIREVYQGSVGVGSAAVSINLGEDLSSGSCGSYLKLVRRATDTCAPTTKYAMAPFLA